MRRLLIYGSASTGCALGCILLAFSKRPNFYSACMYLSQSNACLSILSNFLIFITLVIGHVGQAMFFGQLRAIEIEHLYERSWFAITETCLAMTVFRDEFDVRFLGMFVSLLFVKCFHWICQDRVDNVSWRRLYVYILMSRWNNYLTFPRSFIFGWWRCLYHLWSLMSHLSAMPLHQFFIGLI